jgi:hypothetical protein
MRHLLLLALLLLPGAASAQYIEYNPSRETLTTATVTGGTITCGSASQVCTFDAPSTTGPLQFENATATTGTAVAYRYDVAANLVAGDLHTDWRDNNTTSLMSLSGAGVLLTASSITSGGQITAGAANAIGFSGRSFWTSGANGTLTATNAAASDFDTLNLGPATPADIGAVTVSCQNTGTAGCILLANTAASGSADTGWIVRVVGDLASADTALAVQDNNGAGSLFTVSGVGAGLFATSVTAPSIRQTSSASPLAADACNAGTFSWDTGFFYICTASGAWKRVALTGGY